MVTENDSDWIGDSSMTWSLVIPAVPPSGNPFARMHWRDRDELVDKWGLVVSNAIQRAGDKPSFTRAHFEATLYFEASRKRDIPNFLTTLDKLVIDHVVKAGILPDDNSDVIPEFTVRFEIDESNPRTEITLTAL